MKQSDYDNLGPKIKKLRVEMDFTQAQVAEALDVTPGYIALIPTIRPPLWIMRYAILFIR